MTFLIGYVLRWFISLRYITANVVDRNNGRIVVTASTVEYSIKKLVRMWSILQCQGSSCGWRGVEGLEQGLGRGIHVDVNKQVEKKGFKNCTKIWAIVNALKNNGVKLILDENRDNTSTPSY